ncbi:MAG: HD domain-containing protein [Phycisphaerales bacterium]|nr:HD domain-containing protein [Phycisphaerales bacterium]
MSTLTPSMATTDEGAALRVEFDALLGVCSKLNEARPVEELLDELLRQARLLTRAEAGTVYVAEGGKLRFVCAQNEARRDLDITPRVDERRFLTGTLGGKTIAIDETSLAGHAAWRREALRIRDAYELPAGESLRFDPSFDRMTGYRTRSMIVAPLVDRSAQVVGVLQLINRLDEAGIVAEFSARDMQVVEGLASMAALSVRNAQMRDELYRSHLDTILRLSTAAEFRDTETSQHIQRVSLYCETIGRWMGAPRDWTRLMLFASPMHDVGKLGVPDAILQKPGKLTEEERLIMQRHTLIGAHILKGADNELLRFAEKIALSHHERWDGAGYPHRLAGTEIPLEGRVTAVADVFDALTSKRCYKPAFSVDWAFEEIAKNRGTQFDPEAVDAFVRARPEVEVVFDAYRPAQPVEESQTPVNPIMY